MKILYVNNLYDPYVFGGAERTLQHLVEGITGRGHEAVVLTTGPSAGVAEETRDGIRIIRAGVRNIYWHAVRTKPSILKRGVWHLLDSYNLAMKRVVREVVKREGPDVVSCHNLSGFSISVWDAVHELKVPMAHVLHDQYLICPSCTMYRNGAICRHQCLPCRILRSGCRRRSNKVGAVVGVSGFILNDHLRNGYFRQTPIRKVIHNARSHPAPGSVPRRDPDGRIRFGFIGTLTPSKGIELLLETFAAFAERDWELHIAGSGVGKYEEDLRRRYRRPDVVFLGVQRPEDFYPNIDVLVVPSIWNEPLGVVTFEGMAFGSPVIGANRGGIPEVVKNWENGLLFDPQSPAGLSAAMRKMARDTDFRISASKSAMESARYFLDTARFVSGYENFYQELCDRKP